jgi:hypothetical protein
MTIGIAAITGDRKHIVTGSDRLLSSSEGVVQGIESTLKARRIAKSWALMFSATDANLFMPILGKVMDRLGNVEDSYELDLKNVQNVVVDVYREEFDATFTSRYLVRYGFKSIADFRLVGLSQFGDQKFQEICDTIDKFDLGIQLLAYGFDQEKKPHLFQVDNPGQIIDNDLLGYAVIGSGFYMASASLHRKRMPYHLAPLIYRVLEAKFSAETAPGVGKRTALFWMGDDGESGSMGYGSIDKIRGIWEETLNAPEPQAAIDIITALTTAKKSP